VKREALVQKLGEGAGRRRFEGHMKRLPHMAITNPRGLRMQQQAGFGATEAAPRSGLLLSRTGLRELVSKTREAEILLRPDRYDANLSQPSAKSESGPLGIGANSLGYSCHWPALMSFFFSPGRLKPWSYATFALANAWS
jgi:hypothetical protein